MPNDATRVEIITGRERRRRYWAEQKLALVEEAMRPGMTVSAVARLLGDSPSLLFNWRKLMSQGGNFAVEANDDVVAASRARELEQRVRELERPLGRKTMEFEIFKAARLSPPLGEKSPSDNLSRRLGTLPGEGCGRRAWGREVQPRPAARRRRQDAWPLSQA